MAFSRVKAWVNDIYLSWWQTGPRSRHPGYTAWSSGGGCKNQPTEEDMEEDLILLE